MPCHLLPKNSRDLFSGHSKLTSAITAPSPPTHAPFPPAVPLPRLDVPYALQPPCGQPPHFSSLPSLGFPPISSPPSQPPPGVRGRGHLTSLSISFPSFLLRWSLSPWKTRDPEPGSDHRMLHPLLHSSWQVTHPLYQHCHHHPLTDLKLLCKHLLI